ncbi:MAG: hypothetical protein U0359_11240 [Byssovorax sp.]
MAPQALVAYVDVDDTLVRSFGSKRIPMGSVVDHVRELHRRGVTLYCWSTAGAEYAHASARELGLEACFSGFLPKPNVIIDDQNPAEWRQLVCVHPNEATSKTVDDYHTLLSTGRAS